MTTVIVIGVILIALILYSVTGLYSIVGYLRHIIQRTEQQQKKIDEIEYHLDHTIQNKLDSIESKLSRQNK